MGISWCLISFCRKHASAVSWSEEDGGWERQRDCLRGRGLIVDAEDGADGISCGCSAGCRGEG